MRVGKVCEQIAFGKQLFPVRGKYAPLPTESLRYGQCGPYCLDLGAVASTPTKARKPAKKQSTKAQVVASTSLVLTVPIQKELSRKVERKLSDQMSLEFNSPPDIKPPSTLALQQTALPLLALEETSAPQVLSEPLEWDGDTEMQWARSSIKRHRVDPFRHMVSKARPRALPGLVTENYFSVLAEMEVEIKDVEEAGNPERGKRYEFLPVKAKMPGTVAASKEAAHFFRKRHTKVEKEERPTRVGEVGEKMKIDIQNTIHTIRPDKLFQADRQIEHVRRILKFSTNPDKIIRTALDHPIAMNGVLLACMESNDPALDCVAQLLMINRVFAAHDLNEDVTFATH